MPRGGGTPLVAAFVVAVGGFIFWGGQGSAVAAGSGHGEHKTAGATLMVTTDPAEVRPGRPVRLGLMLHDASGAMLKEFEVVHEKKLHLIIVRDALDRFAHIHPSIDRSGSITATFTFPTAGRYRLFADFKPAGGAAATAMAEVTVAGDAPPGPALAPNVPGRVAGDGLGADVAVVAGKSGGGTRVSFTILDRAGKQVVDLQPYLGAMGHLVVLDAGGTQYVHAHPVAGSPGDAVVFEVLFPGPGIYKGWGQFQRAGRVHDIPFVVAVK
jgi:hypothetical protein